MNENTVGPWKDSKHETPDRLPCGCEFGTGIDDGLETFFYRPCSFTCEVYSYVMSQSQKQSKPLYFRMDER